MLNEIMKKANDTNAVTSPFDRELFLNSPVLGIDLENAGLQVETSPKKRSIHDSKLKDL